ncbi:hypothetical protein E4U43_007074 [Claviceps pusilla]|uniref:Uncharacterized protein n=1 Tax=Claviceps pusilla TaxID=123648 RepID=A0A9P7ND60_9HYPO|nr:hypothetical protein E4U43_007074 [Claviceps pusilla]
MEKRIASVFKVEQNGAEWQNGRMERARQAGLIRHNHARRADCSSFWSAAVDGRPAFGAIPAYLSDEQHEQHEQHQTRPHLATLGSPGPSGVPWPGVL